MEGPVTCRIDSRSIGGRFRFDGWCVGAAVLGGAALLGGCGSGVGSQASPPPIQVTVSGGGQVRLGSTAQLTASVVNTTNTAVTWQVNGFAGGSSTVGTI